MDESRTMHNQDQMETITVPGMVRWGDEDGDAFFLKRLVPDSTDFVLGLEAPMDGTFIFLTSIAFRNEDAEDLIRKIAEFNGLAVEVKK